MNKTNFFEDNKYIKFFLPKPSLCILILFGFIFFNGEINGKPISVLYWFHSMVALFIVFIIPLDTVLWFCKKIIKFFSENIERHKNILSNPVRSKMNIEPEPEPEPEPEQ